MDNDREEKDLVGCVTKGLIPLYRRMTMARQFKCRNKEGPIHCNMFIMHFPSLIFQSILTLND